MLNQPLASSAIIEKKKRRICPPCVFFGILTWGAIIWGLILLVKRFVG